MGAVGGGLWHLFKGAKNSPSGARFKGGIEVSLPPATQLTEASCAAPACIYTFEFKCAGRVCLLCSPSGERLPK